MTRPRLKPSARPYPALTRSLRRLHRYAGVAAGAVLLYLLTTGLPLQFDSLNLGDRYVSASFILDAYNLDAPERVSFDAGVAQVGDRLYWQQQQIAQAGSFLGALSYQDLIVVGTPEALYLFPPGDPDQIERIDQRIRLSGIGLLDSQLVLNAGGDIQVMDAALLNASPLTDPAQAIQWQSPELISGTAAEPYRQIYRLRLLSVQRLLQDLHSGRALVQ